MFPNLTVMRYLSKISKTQISTNARGSVQRAIRSCSRITIFSHWTTILGLCVGALLITACGNGGAQADEPGEQFQIREPQATFTPTVIGTSADTVTGTDSTTINSGITSGNSTASSESTEATSVDTTTNNDSPSTETADSTENGNGATASVDARFAGTQAVISSALVNGRAGPGTDFGIVGVVAENEIFDVLGQNDAGDWWHLCCYLDEEFWVINDFVTVDQAAQAAAQPVAQPAAPVQPAAAPTQPAASPTDTPEPATEQPAQPPAPQEFAFDLVVQEQFSESSVVRIFLYVFSDSTQALQGYTLKVTKSGSELAVGAKSYGPQPGYTWPIAATRQRFENMKIEFPGESPAGTWTVQLADGSGQVVGPPATFELTGSEPNRELYVRYKEK